MNHTAEILKIAQRIRPLLAGHPPAMQGAVLAELTSIWLAGHHCLDDPNKTPQLRSELLARHCELVMLLTLENAKKMPN